MADALPALLKVVRAMKAARLEGVLIGNAGAALQGAPVATLDVDFFIRDTAQNRTKIKAVAKELRGAVVQPFAPVSYMHRIIGGPVEVDMVVGAAGIRSFESLRSRATLLSLGHGLFILVADLHDIIKSKKAAGRPKDLAVMPILERTLHEKEREEAEEK